MRHRLLLGCVVPRPIAWVTTVGEDGLVNVAPFSFFTVVSTSPPLLAITVERHPDGREKHTASNVRATGELVVNIAAQEHREVVEASAAELPREAGEAERLGLATTPSVDVRPPRVTGTPIAIECVVHDIIRPGGDEVVIAWALRFHVERRIGRASGHIDVDALRPLARTGGTYRALAPVTPARDPGVPVP
ncbi:flavin reductase family protein [Patulibacter sp. NPDC049589]|uniref:flavin reductase family protein n=1 Tax=Patulibacter sp. NPDC049589 TaxID=3154731 RepID=UPI0034371CE9